jgi:hypothetical protein
MMQAVIGQLVALVTDALRQLRMQSHPTANAKKSGPSPPAGQKFQ